MKPFIIILSALLFSLTGFAQDPSFSQIENTRNYAHPSDVLIRQGYEIELAHRSEWNSTGEAYNTSFLSFFYQHEKMKSGYGVKLMQDVEGVGSLKTTDLKFVYRYSFFSFNYYNPRALFISLEGGVVRKSIDWSQLIFSDQIDPVFGIYTGTDFIYPDNDVNFFDAGASITYRDRIKMNDFRLPFSASASLKHIYGDRVESLKGIGTKIYPLFTLTVSSTIHAVDYYGLPLLKPTFRYEYQGNLKKLTFGSLIGKANEQYQRTVYVGLFISNQYNPISPLNTNSFILLAGFEKVYNRYLTTIAYSYDVNTAGLGNLSSGGTHEITINISFSTIEKGFTQPSNTFQKCPE